MNGTIAQSVEILAQGGIVVFPTDTAFGIGCRVDSIETVERLFAVRNRAIDKAVPVLVGSTTMAQQYWHSSLSDIVRRLVKQYWPGALTIVYDANVGATPPLLRGGGTTIGLRLPDHPVPQTIIKRLGVGLVGASANIAGAPTPFRRTDLDEQLLRRVDYVAPGECTGEQVSTVIVVRDERITILRQGAVVLSKEEYAQHNTP